jgi:Flp pilus assembly protein protease CpaA
MIYISIVGLLFLIYFSYQDLKHRQINQLGIIVFFIVGAIWTIKSNRLEIFLIQIIFFLILIFLWTKNSVGGGDVKILVSLLPYVLINTKNIYAYSILFLIGLGLFSLFVVGIIKLIQFKKIKFFPYLPIITIYYSLFVFTFIK